ncbi:MAG: 4Fe-4S dicluster domain-containing protein [Desulfomonilaceae bacterium]
MNKTICVNVDLCVGCGACVVACMDQNDIYPEKGQPAFRRIYQFEDGEFPNAIIRRLSISCMHCTHSPCMIGCPTKAITRDNRTGAVIVNQRLCIGCHTCALACPLGVPRYDEDGKMWKCDLCIERVEAGMEPACVRVCPVGALKFDYVNSAQGKREFEFAGNILNSVSMYGTGAGIK